MPSKMSHPGRLERVGLVVAEMVPVAAEEEESMEEEWKEEE